MSMKLNEMRLYGTCTSSGALTDNGERAVNGFLEAVEWIDGDFADGVDAVISCYSTASAVDNTLLTLSNANDDKIYYPRAELAGWARGGCLDVEGTLRVFRAILDQSRAYQSELDTEDS